MSDLLLTANDDLRTIAFKVGTALIQDGIKAVVTGGSAATIYAPLANQSRGIDLILEVYPSVKDVEQSIAKLGFQRAGRVYSHAQVPITLDFPDDQIHIGADQILSTAILTEGPLSLHILTPTDCVRDRLASFYWYRDRSALKAALGVASLHPIDMQIVKEWSIRENEEEKFREFQERLDLEDEL